MPSAGATLIYAAPKNWLLFGGADWSHDITREAEQASVRKGVRLGVFKTFSDGLGLRANLRYSCRVFDAPGTLVYRFVRKDREYQAGASVWHEKLSWKGLVPRLNLQYLKVDRAIWAASIRGGICNGLSAWRNSFKRARHTGHAVGSPTHETAAV